jgi:DNA-binding MarR family transcriptional regulator
MPNTSETTSDLQLQVGELLGRFSAEVIKHSACDMLRMMRQADLSMPRVAALMFVARRRATSISDISEHLNLALGTTSHIVDQMVEAGLVERQENPLDRRLKHITLTERGQVCMEQFQQARVADLARRIEVLPEPLLGRLRDVLTDVLEQLHKADNGQA